MGLLTLLGSVRQPMLAVVALAVVIPHSLMGHKEYRFIYPMIPMLLILAALGAGSVHDWLARRRAAGAFTVVTVLFFVGSSLWAALDFHAGKTPVGMAFRPAPVNHWVGHRGRIEAFKWLSRQPQLCGLALYNVPWQWVGGYAYLHRAVPVVPDGAEAQDLDAIKLCNYAIAEGELPIRYSDYRPVKSFGSVQVYLRAGGCDSPGDYHINRWLEAQGH
jgi:hypothetical protein